VRADTNRDAGEWVLDGLAREFFEASGLLSHCVK